MIRLFDKENLHELHWPDTEEARQAKAMLVPMMEEGVEAYIQNVSTKLFLLQVDSHIIPLTVNEKEYDNSYVASNYYFIQMLQEMAEKKNPRLYSIQKPLIQTLGHLFKGMKINKMLIVNNWLLSSTIYPDFTDNQISEITHFLISKFPGHLLIFRSLDEKSCTPLIASLRNLRYRMIMSRYVYMYDSDKKSEFSSKINYRHRRDRRLVQSQGFEVVSDRMMNLKEIDRLLQLYQGIYIDKHTSYSPSYTNKFLDRAIQNSFLKMYSLKKDGEVAGVVGVFQRKNGMTAPFLGYDIRKNVNQLYGMLTQIAIDEAEQQQVVLNDGSGAGIAKLYRGMNAVPEFIAVYDQHLPFYRRLFWSLSEKVVEHITYPLLKRKMNSFVEKNANG